MKVLLKYRAYIVIAFAFSFALFVFITIQSPTVEKDAARNLAFLGTGAFSNILLFLFLLTEVFGPIAENRSKVNKLMAWIFIFTSAFISVVMLFGLIAFIVFFIKN